MKRNEGYLQTTVFRQTQQGWNPHPVQVYNLIYCNSSNTAFGYHSTRIFPILVYLCRSPGLPDLLHRGPVGHACMHRDTLLVLGRIACCLLTDHLKAGGQQPFSLGSGGGGIFCEMQEKPALLPLHFETLANRAGV